MLVFCTSYSLISDDADTLTISGVHLYIGPTRETAKPSATKKEVVVTANVSTLLCGYNLILELRQFFSRGRTYLCIQLLYLQPECRCTCISCVYEPITGCIPVTRFRRKTVNRPFEFLTLQLLYQHFLFLIDVYIYII